MTNVSLERLRNAVANDAAIRRVQRLQPAGGPGDKIFPPTYPGERTNDPARHLFETRRINGGVGAKFARCIVSEIVGVGVAEGQKGAVRIDPLGIRASVKVVGGPLDWTIATGAKGEKSERPSEINHSNIISNLVPGGATIDYAYHTAVITCAGLRRLRFPEIPDETAGRSVLAALALVALVEQERSGYALRSRCDLVCDGRASFEIVHPNGSSESFDVDADGCIGLLNQSVEAAKAAGFTWNPEPIRLRPQPRLAELVALSRAKALAGESEAENA
jgi:CRISPR-associated protein Csb1